MKSVSLFISHFDGIGGAERVANTIANGLVQDFKVSIIALYGPPASQSLMPIDPRIATGVLLPEEGRLRRMARDIRKPLRAFLKEQGTDVILLIGSYQSCLALPALVGSKIKSVNCDHGALINSYGDKTITFMRRIASIFCDRTVLLTQRSLQDYRRLFHTPARKLQVIYNSVSPEQCSKKRPYDPSAKRIIWAGRFSEEKGLDLLLKIASKVLPSNPDWLWDIYGIGDFSSFVAEVEDKDLSSQLIFKGQCNDLSGVYGDYGLLSLTSYKEGLPLVLLEAKACGLPLISFDTSTGPGDIIRDGLDGFLVDCFDVDEYSSKLESLMRDDALRCRMAAASAENLEIFEEGPILSQWKELIQKL